MTEEKLTGYPSIDKPWLKYYSEDVTIPPLPEGNMYEYLKACNKGADLRKSPILPKAR